MTTRLFHLSDTHLHREPGLTTPHRTKVAIDPDRDLQQTIELYLAQYGIPDVVVHTGDIADDGSVEATERAFAALAAIGAPVVAIPGNHDLPEVVDRCYTGERCVGYPTVALWENGACRVLGFDSTIPATVPGRIDADFVAEVLDSLDNTPTVVALHHPVSSRSSLAAFQTEGDVDLLQVLNSRDHVGLVLTGHTHQMFINWTGDVVIGGGLAVHYPIAHDGDHAMAGVGMRGALHWTIDASARPQPAVVELPYGAAAPVGA